MRIPANNSLTAAGRARVLSSLAALLSGFVALPVLAGPAGSAAGPAGLGAGPVIMQAGGPMLTASVTQTSVWSTGYGAKVKLTNAGDAPSAGWVVEFDLPAGTSVTNSWSSVRTQAGQHYRFTNVSYNGEIAPGGSKDFGFNASGLGLPFNCTVNGFPCSGSPSPSPTPSPTSSVSPSPSPSPSRRPRALPARSWTSPHRRNWPARWPMRARDKRFAWHPASTGEPS